ncbi:unnamed protein product, partial [Rotaria sp. Silwood1]
YIGGIIGAVLTGLFPEKWVNSRDGVDGAFYGRPIQLWYQIAGVLTAIAFASVCTAGILYPLDWIMGIRLAKEDELQGLDLTAHGESWQVTASRTVSDLVRKILDEEGVSKEEAEDAGTLELHYNPKNPNKKPFKIPLFKRIMSRNFQSNIDSISSNEIEQNHNTAKLDDDETHTQANNTHIIHF